MAPQGQPGLYYEEILTVQFPYAETTTAWCERIKAAGPAPLCACGCGKRIVIRPRHRATGLPRYIVGHFKNPIQHGLAKLRSSGYKLLGEVAALIGVSETKFRSMEAEGLVPRARRLEYVRGRSARVYSATDVARITKSRLGERERERRPRR
jgi:hypothetical protein